MKHFNLACALSIAISCFANSGAASPVPSEQTVFGVNPQTAKLEIERVEFRQHGEPVLIRRFERAEKERGLFGPAWCSNIDIMLVGVDSGNPKLLELRECGQKKSRMFHKILDAWVEDSSSSRILRKADGRWELTEAPYPIFRSDGRLDSFQVGQFRWHVRRDSNGRPKAIDSLRTKPIKFRRNGSEDLEAILDSKGQTLVRYSLGVYLESAEFGGVRESYEYDADGNILRLLRNQQVWRFSYASPDRLASAQDPEGCNSRWIFERNEGGSIARETRTCSKASSGSAPMPVAAGSRKEVSAPEVEVLKSGPMGIGKEKAKVSVNSRGFPIAFQVEGPPSRRLEIVREEGSDSAILVRSAGVEVSFRNRPREYSSKQLELLDEYEEWMAAWGDR